MSRCTVSGLEPTNDASAPTPTDATLRDGQKADHWVMCPGEIIKQGFKRPVRMSYQHVGIPGPEFPLIDLTEEQRTRYGEAQGYVAGSAIGRYWRQSEIDKIDKGCRTVTSMPISIAETYAAEPGFYGSTFCCGCRAYLPVGERGEFVWQGTQNRVGT